MRLGELLVAQNLVTAEHVEEALSRQILHGGRLGSNLVEMRVLSMENLALALGRLHHKPAAMQSHFGLLDLAVARKLSPEMAASWHAVPLGRTGAGGDAVAIATTDPFSDDILYECREVFGCEIVQAISPELRLLYWLERVYGIERINRFKRVMRPGDEEFHKEPTDPERRGYVQTLTDVEEPDETSALARIAVKRMALPISGELDAPIDPNDLDDALRRIRKVTGRNRVGDITSFVLEYGFDQCFGAGMIVIARDDLLIGWRGFVRDQDKSIDALAIPVDADALVTTAFKTGESFFGLPETPSVVDTRMWHFLGGTPAEVAVIPIEVIGKVACLLYVQSAEPIPAEYVGTLGELSGAIAAGLTRLIRANQR